MKYQYKKFFKKHLKTILIVLVILSVVEFLYVLMFGNITDEVKEKLPFVFLGMLISEALFLTGIAIMAFAIEHEIGWNPLKWRKHLKDVLVKVPNNKLFWTGFWINAVGAFLTGAIWLAAIVFGLPIGAWGIIWLPISDIVLTVSLRFSILELKKENVIG